METEEAVCLEARQPASVLPTHSGYVLLQEAGPDESTVFRAFLEATSPLDTVMARLRQDTMASFILNGKMPPYESI